MIRDLSVLRSLHIVALLLPLAFVGACKSTAPTPAPTADNEALRAAAIEESTATIAGAAIASGPRPADSSASPQRTGLTARLFGGAGFLRDTNLTSDDAGAIQNGDASFDVGWMGGGALGYRFHDSWSADVEMTYRTNNLDRVTAAGTTVDDGDFSSLSVLTNLRYHLPVAGPLRPYVGAGAGWIEEIDIDLETLSSETGYSASGVGAQLLLGAEYALSDRLSLDVEGRYFRSFADSFDSEDGPAITYDADYDRFEVVFGLSWRF